MQKYAIASPRPSAAAPLRFRFESRAALLEGLASAQQAGCVEDCLVEWPRLVLELRLDPGVTRLRGRTGPWLERIQSLALPRL